MAFLDYNLARMRGIDEKVGQMSSQAFQGEQAAKGRFFGGMQNLAGTLNARSAAEKLAGAKVTEAGAGREFQGAEAAKIAEAIKASEDRMYAAYNDGSYTDETSNITYSWGDKPEFEMALAQLRADRARMDRDKEKGLTDIYGAFQNTLGELSMIFPAGGLDPGTLMYNTEWMLENKEDFRSAFNEFTSSKYSKEEQNSLNRLLESYLKSYALTLEEEPTGGEGFFQNIFPNVPKGEAVGGGAGLERLARQAGEGEPITKDDNMWRVMQGMIDMVSTNKPQIVNDPTMKNYMKDINDGNITMNAFEKFMKFLDSYNKQFTY